MKIKIDSQIKITNPSKEILDYIKTYLEIKNPEVQKKQASRTKQTLKVYITSSL